MIVLSLLYALLIAFFTIGLLKKNKSANNEKNNISVIVAARNEEKNIINLLKSFEKQTYKNFELIIIDDRSTDNTYKLVEKYIPYALYPMKLYKITQTDDRSGKKRAVSFGIGKSSYDILAFTDADCMVPKNWLEEINKAFDSQTDFICGYSELIYQNKFMTYIKNIERSGYMASVAGAYAFNIDLSAAASNMAYRKRLFYYVKGFENIDNVKSGDDDLLLHKMKKKIRKLKFLLNPKTVVISFVDKSLSQQYETEKRRASKWKLYPWNIKLLSLFIFIYYIVFLIGSVYLLITGDFEKFLFLVLIKIIPEFLLILIFLIKIGRLKYIVVFPLAELIYIPYYIFFGLKGLKGKYTWKE